jgi:hypothetical protein
MPDAEPYYFRQSAEENVVDIFINDNHPFVAAKATDESGYLMFVRMCVMDAIVEHVARASRSQGIHRNLPRAYEGSAPPRHQGLNQPPPP